MKKLLEEYLNEAYQIEGILICLSYKTKAELYIKKNNNIIKTIKDKKITKEEKSLSDDDMLLKIKL